MSTSQPPDVERLRAALASLGDDPGWPIVDAAHVFDAAHGRLSVGERRAVVDELVRNPQAAVAWRLALAVDPGASVSTTAPQPGRTWRWLSMAAVLALVGGLAWQFQPWRSDTPIYRSADPRRIASLVPANATLARNDAILRWSTIEDARYRVRLFTLALDQLDESDELTVPEYRLHQDTLSQIPRGGRVLWQVEARVPGSGAVVSPTFSVQIE